MTYIVNLDAYELHPGVKSLQFVFDECEGFTLHI